MWAGWKQKGISFCVELGNESDPTTPLQRSSWAVLQRNILFQRFLCSTDEPTFPFQLSLISFYLPVRMHINRFWQPLDPALPERPGALWVFCLTPRLFPSWEIRSRRGTNEIIWGCGTMSMRHLWDLCAFPFSFQVERSSDPAEPLQSSSREGLTLFILWSHPELMLPGMSAGLVHQAQELSSYLE